MNKAIKAALFNALLFPGWGQIYLKQYKKSILIISAVMAGTLSILWSVIQATRELELPFSLIHNQLLLRLDFTGI
ncbi:MAG: hypothetical protein STSR0002_00840 [Smithella sp.]|jgi:TM2 domain-containing membrane protein YozV